MRWERLCRLGDELPEVVEDVWFRTPALKVRGKSFCRLKEDGQSVVFLVDCVDEQEYLIETQPEVYYITDHYRGYPAVLARLSALRVPEARRRLEGAWRRKAPRALVRQLDERLHQRARDEAPRQPSSSPSEPTVAGPRGAHNNALERLRRLCLALPEATERLSHGEPTWFVHGKRVFVTYADHHHDQRVAFWCAAPFGVQDVLVTAEPGRYFVPPYVGGRGWVGVWLDVPQDWKTIENLVVDAYRTVAPRRLVVALDAATP